MNGETTSRSLRGHSAAQGYASLPMRRVRDSSSEVGSRVPRLVGARHGRGCWSRGGAWHARPPPCPVRAARNRGRPCAGPARSCPPPGCLPSPCCVRHVNQPTQRTRAVALQQFGRRAPPETKDRTTCAQKGRPYPPSSPRPDVGGGGQNSSVRDMTRNNRRKPHIIITLGRARLPPSSPRRIYQQRTGRDNNKKK